MAFSMAPGRLSEVGSTPNGLEPWKSEEPMYCATRGPIAVPRGLGPAPWVAPRGRATMTPRSWAVMSSQGLVDLENGV